MGFDWIAVSAISGAVVAGGTVSVFLFRHLHPRMVAARQFWEHLVGIPANPITGQDRIPGLFERIESLDTRIEERLDQQDATLAAQDQSLATIVHELFPNSGKSMRDDQNGIASQVQQLAADLRAHIDSCNKENK